MDLNIPVVTRSDRSKCTAVCDNCVFMHCMAFIRWGREQKMPLVGMN